MIECTIDGSRELWRGKHALGDVGHGSADYLGRHRDDARPLARHLDDDGIGRHSLGRDRSGRYDVWRFVGMAAGLHPTRFDPDYCGRHRAAVTS